jgi:hypothetical protein
MTASDIASQGYVKPYPKAKFQLNDWVVISGNTFSFVTSQSKRSVKYIGQYGKIVGYKPGSQYVKYAIQFPADNNNIETFHSHFIVGPYNSVESAKSAALKKFDPTLTTPFLYKPKLQSNMVRGYTTAAAQSKPAVEAKLSEMFSQAPFNLTVPTTPLKFDDGKYVATIIAYRPITGPLASKKINEYSLDIKIQSPKLKQFMAKNICLFRLNNAISKKFTDLTSSTQKLRDNDGPDSQMIWSNTPYAFNMPEIDLSRMAYGGEVMYFLDKEKFLNQLLNDPANRFLTNKIFSIPVVMTKRPELINQIKEEYEQLLNLVQGDFDAQKMFDEYYGVVTTNGKRVAYRDIVANEQTLHYFNDVHLEYTPANKRGYNNNFDLTVTTNNIDQCKIPPQFSCVKLQPADLSKTKKLQLTNLNFLPKDVKELELASCAIKSFQGIPDPINSLMLDRCTTKTGTLEGMPKVINTYFELRNSGFKTLKGCENTVVGDTVNIYGETELKSIEDIPESKSDHYRLPQSFNVDQVAKIIETRKFNKSLKPKTQKSFADIFKGLN